MDWNTKRAKIEGVPILTALKQLATDCVGLDSVVAHNLSFDLSMIEIECIRHMFDNPIAPIPERICTMQIGKNICKIEKRSQKGKVYYKFPKLIELHERLFGKNDKYRLHDALIDTILCLRCYLQIEHAIDITSFKKIKVALSADR